MRTFLAIVITLAFSLTAAAQSVPGAVPLNLPYYQFLNSNGAPLSNGYACFFASGTSTAQNVYTDSTANTPITATNGCIRLDASGAATIWLGPNPYRFLKKDSNGAQVGPTIDGVVDSAFNWLGNVLTAGSAALISFTQAGTGGAAQTVYSKLTQYVNAADFAGADMGTKINAAIASLNSTYGGDVTVPPGVYGGCATITLSNPVRLHCATPGNDGFTPACMLNFSAATDGITCTDPGGRHSIIEGLALSGGGGSSAHNGINANCKYLNIRQTTVKQFPQHGISVAPASGLSANYWRFDDVHAWSNTGSGFYFDAVLADQGTCTNCEANNNTAYDFNLRNVSGSTFITAVSNGAGSGSFNLESNAVGNIFVNPQCASSGTFSIAGAGNLVLGTSALPCAITNTGGGNRIFAPVSVDNVENGVAIGPEPQTAGKVYKLRSGVLGAGILDLYDVTDAWSIFKYDPSTKAWTWDATGMPGGPVGTYTGVATQTVVTGSRALGTPYHNTGTRPMFVSAYLTANANAQVAAYTDSAFTPTTQVAGLQNGVGSSQMGGNISFWVMPGNYYQILQLTPTAAIVTWTEWQ